MTSFSADSQSKLIAVDFDPFADGELLLTAPATASQQEIWASVQMGDAANCAYNLSQSLRLKGELNESALESALQQLVHRHEALRTTLSTDGNTLCIVASLQIDIPKIDLSTWTSSARDEKLAQIVKQDVSKPFNIEQGPLFRAQIIKLDPYEHLLLVNAHHIVCDGWSWGVLIDDLSQLYSANVQGITPDLPEAEKLSEYAILQAQAAQQPESIETEQYWLAQFADSAPVVDFPTDRSRPALRTFNSAREDWDLNPELGHQLRQLGIKSGCSFMTTILAGFEVWLHRLTGQSDLVVGIPSSGQAASGKDRLVGHCTNLLPLRTQIDGEISFSDYLQIRRSTILDAYDNQQFTFGSLVSKLALPRDSSRIPLVPIIFNFDRDPESNISFTGLELKSCLNPRDFENFELFVNAVELDGKIVLECQYNTNLFDVDTIRRRIAEFETLLLSIVANPAQSIEQLPMLPDAERQKLLVDWNQTQVDYPNQCIHQLFEAQVERTPDNIAVVFEDLQLTYRELNNRANQLAHYLRSRGVGKDVLVGLYAERSLAMVVGLWGILKAGGAYVPLDPTHPQDRVAYIFADSNAKVLIGDAQLLASLPAHRAEVLALDTNSAEIDRQPRSNPVTDTQPDRLAYVIYTSGSTGHPKGVEVCHQSQANLLHHLQHSPGLTSADTLLAVTTICFDTSTVDMFLPLVVGAKIVLVSSEVAADGFQLLAKLTDTGATFMQATPASFRLLLAAGWTGSPHLRAVSTGEALPRNLADLLLEKVAELWDLYGPTETTVWSTGAKINDLRRSADFQGAVELIGKPLSNIQAYILVGGASQNESRSLQPLPIGVMGELHIGGDCLAKGYLNRPDLTAEKFIADPFSDAPNARLYKTGDLVRYLPDGNIEYIGRIDNQVKIRGFRIELGEIEAVLVKHPAVQAVAVIVREDVPGDPRLVAYIVIDSLSERLRQRVQPPTINLLREFLAHQLPSYMIPAAFVWLDALPLTPTGKIDRRALPAPDGTSNQPDTNFVAPSNPTQEILARIWSQILRIDRIGIHDNFFELGGHSLLATQVISRFRQEFSIEIPLQALFEQPTIASLSDRIATLLWIEASRQANSTVSATEMEEFEV
jgi:amino acid adenylation domain-containing protein